MKERPYLTRYAEELHERSKVAGFWEKDHSDRYCICLVVGELMEAVEADRKGKRANYNSMVSDYYDSDFKIAFEDCIKDSFEDELADTVIRLLDLAGKHYLRVEPNHDIYLVYESDTVPEVVYRIIKFLTTDVEPDGWEIKLSDRINRIIAFIEDYTKDLGIDLWLHVELKMKYNLTRSYKHDKEY